MMNLTRTKLWNSAKNSTRNDMKKIMFNDKYGLTEAVLSGRKTQTRRIIKPQPTFNENHGIVWRGFAYGLSLQLDEIKGSCKNFITGTEYDKSCNRYRVDEVVAVAQSYKNAGYSKYAINRAPKTMEIRGHMEQSEGWTNKMFVRAEACKNRIRITNVRVERLQDIPDEDCIKEGVIKGRVGSEDTHFMDAYYVPNMPLEPCVTPQRAYAALIDRISGKGTWESNPYVFVYDFELVKS